MMISIGEKVVYRANGVCVVEEIQLQVIPSAEDGCRKKERECYVLRPISDPGIKIFVPLDNETLIAQIHPLLSPDEMLALLEKTGEAAMPWIPELRARSNAFRDQLAQGDRFGLIAMLKLLYHRRANMAACGKKLYAIDEGTMKRAEKLLFEEIAHSLEMAQDEVAQLFYEKAMADYAEGSE